MLLIIIVNSDRRLRLSVSLVLFRCCNQRLLVKLLSSIAHADAPTVAADQSTVVVAVAVVDATDPEL